MRVCRADPLCSGHGGEASADLREKFPGVERDLVDFDLVGIEAVEVQQVTDQTEQVIRRSFHIAQVKALTLFAGQPHQQVDVAHDRAGAAP